jgi:predicted O-methyltransferase YrrM
MRLDKVNQALGKLHRLVHRATFTPANLARLEQLPQPRAKQVAEAYRAAGASSALPAEEEKALAAIESLRERLKKDKSVEPGGENKKISELVPSSRSPAWCRYLYQLVRHTRPKQCLEFGTCLGISAAYQAAALRANGEGGRLITMEGDKGRAELSQRHLAALGYKASEVQVALGKFDEILPTVLQELGGLDYVFVDGHHQEEPTIRYLEAIAPKLSATALVLFDDILWTAGMKRAWREISSHDRFSFSINSGQIGLCVTGEPDTPPQSFTIFLR